MDQTWNTLVKNEIDNYISNIDINHPDFDVNTLKENIKNIVGVIPAIDIKWTKETKINELKKSAGLTVEEYTTVIEKGKQINISFIDSNKKIYNLKYIF